MKYIIELEKIEDTDFWKAKTKMGANTFVFSQYDIDHMLSLYDEPTEHDECDAGCRWFDEDLENPCNGCKRYDKYKDLYEKPKKTIKRWETYNGDFSKAVEVFREMLCSTEHLCYDCRLHNNIPDSMTRCFGLWLMEDIEVEE